MDAAGIWRLNKGSMGNSDSTLNLRLLVSSKDNVAECFDYDVTRKQMLPNVLQIVYSLAL